MHIGVPREVKQDEYRVGMIPAGVEELTRAGHRVVIEAGAGLGSGITDEQYTEAGAQIEFRANAHGIHLLTWTDGGRKRTAKIPL